jgi:hypothetical protein
MTKDIFFTTLRVSFLLDFDLEMTPPKIGCHEIKDTGKIQRAIPSDSLESEVPVNLTNCKQRDNQQTNITSDRTTSP